jgi:hypothetical protein
MTFYQVNKLFILLNLWENLKIIISLSFFVKCVLDCPNEFFKESGIC